MASTEALLEAALAPGDLDAAEGLVAEAGWNQDRADWRIFLELGRALSVKDEGGRLAATAATLPYAGGFGWISMVLVTSAFRRRGIATRLLGRCIDLLRGEGRVPVLDATPAGREVYRPLGFRDGWPITRWRRTGSMQHDLRTNAEDMQDGDWREVLDLDARAFGCDRGALLARLLARSRAFACTKRRGGRLRGFLLGREGRVAMQLGPIVAESASDAVELAAFAAARVASPVIVDALDRHDGLASWLAANGFTRERPYTRMTLGRDAPFGDPGSLAAIAGPELG